MADGKLEIKGIEDVIADVSKLKNEMSELVKVMSEAVKVNQEYKDTNLKAAKTLTELNKAAAVAKKTEETSLQNKIKAEKFNKELEISEQKRIKSTLDAEAAARRNEAQIEKLNKTTEKATKSGNTWLAALGSFPAKFNVIGNVIGGFIVNGVQKLISGLGNAAMSLINTRKEFEKYEAILKNSLGSSDAARAKMEDLTKVASELPVSLNETVGAFIKLTNRGINPTMEQMRQLTDVALSQGKSLDMYVEAVLDAMSGENERLKEFGIKAVKNGDTTKYTFKGVTTEVNNSSEAINDYLMSIGKMGGVAGTSSVVMNTLEGKISNMNDSFDRLKNNIGDGAFGNAIKGVISAIGGMVSAFADYIATPVSEKMQDELTEINLLGSSITSLNEGSNERNNLLSELLAKYPEYFSNINKDTLKNDEFLKVLAKVNAELEKKILLQQGKEGVESIQKKQLENQKEQVDIIKRINELYKEIFGSYDAELSLSEKKLKVQQKYSDLLMQQKYSSLRSYTDEKFLVDKIISAYYLLNDVKNEGRDLAILKTKALIDETAAETALLKTGNYILDQKGELITKEEYLNSIKVKNSELSEKEKKAQEDQAKMIAFLTEMTIKYTEAVRYKVITEEEAAQEIQDLYTGTSQYYIDNLEESNAIASQMRDEQLIYDLEQAGENTQLIEQAYDDHRTRELESQLSYMEMQRQIIADNDALTIEEKQAKAIQLAQIDANIADQKVAIYENANKKQFDNAKANFEKEKKLKDMQTELYFNLSKSIVVAGAMMAAGQKDAAKNAIKSMVSMALDQLTAIAYAQLAIATVQSLASPESVMTWGVAGSAKSAILGGLIAGAVQVAKIGINSIIDRFEKGTNDAPGGLAFVGEKGSELIKFPDGRQMITPSSATLVNLPKHSEVIPAHLVAKELEDSLNSADIIYKNDNTEVIELLKNLNKKQSVNFSIDKNGIHVISRAGQKTTNWLNKRYRGTC